MLKLSEMIPWRAASIVAQMVCALVEDAAGSQAAFERNIRAAVRGLWSGQTDFAQFSDMMVSALDLGLAGAFYSGAQDMGVDRENVTPEERSQLMTFILGQYNYIGDFGLAIQNANRESGGKLSAFDARVHSWAQRWPEVRDMARALVGKDQPLEWQRGQTEKPCRDCLALDGKVKRASVWAAYPVRPKSPLLACHGDNCDCEQVPTKKPISRGPLPKIG